MNAFGVDDGEVSKAVFGVRPAGAGARAIRQFAATAKRSPGTKLTGSPAEKIAQVGGTGPRTGGRIFPSKGETNGRNPFADTSAKNSYGAVKRRTFPTSATARQYNPFAR